MKSVAALALGLFVVAPQVVAQQTQPPPAAGAETEGTVELEIPEDLMSSVDPSTASPQADASPETGATGAGVELEIPEDLMTGIDPSAPETDAGQIPASGQATEAATETSVLPDPPDDAVPDISIDPTAAAGTSALADFLDAANFTLKQEFAFGTASPYRLVNNRTSFRVEYEKHFHDDFFVRFDTKLTAFWSNDHRARAEDKRTLFKNTSRDAFVQYSTGNTSVKVGRQILIWGESDGGAITDVISPRNFSELFFISLEEARIGQFMATLSRFTPSGDWEFFYVPDAQMNEYPKPGTAYDTGGFGDGFSVVGDVGDRGEYGLRWKKNYGPGDLSLMAASLIDNDTALRRDGFEPDGRIVLRRYGQRFNMLGTAVNYSAGDWIFTGELALKSKLAFNDANFDPLDRRVLDAAVRGEYSLGKGGAHSISLELTNSRILGWSDALIGLPRDSSSAILGYNNTFINENLSLNLISIYSWPYESVQHSLFTTYKWNDRISFTIDLFQLDVDDPNSRLHAFRRDNNVVFRVLYQF